MIVDVLLVSWPDDASRGRTMADAGVPVLYLVAAETLAPVPTTCLEDWVRVPADRDDIYARMLALQFRASSHYASPRLDQHRRVAIGARLLPLPSPEAELAALLVERFEEVVTDEDLVLAAALEGPTMLRKPIHRLRKTFRPHRLDIERAPRIGYRLRPR